MEDMIGLFRRHHANEEDIRGALIYPTRTIQANEGGKFEIKSEEVAPLPKRSRISGAYCFGKRNQDYGNEDQLLLAKTTG